MANTVTITTLSRTQRKVSLYVTIISDGSDESGTVLYNSASQSALIPGGHKIGIVDSKTCSINKVTYTNNSVGAISRLSFDASTVVPAFALPASRTDTVDYSDCGGLKNYAGAGKTGNILITTNGLAAQDVITLVLEVLPY